MWLGLSGQWRVFQLCGIFRGPNPSKAAETAPLSYAGKVTLLSLNVFRTCTVPAVPLRRTSFTLSILTRNAIISSRSPRDVYDIAFRTDDLRLANAETACTVHIYEVALVGYCVSLRDELARTSTAAVTSTRLPQ
jgi:hypothetical protein